MANSLVLGMQYRISFHTVFRGSYLNRVFIHVFLFLFISMCVAIITINIISDARRVQTRLSLGVTQAVQDMKFSSALPYPPKHD